MKIEITKVTVLTNRQSADLIFLDTTLPDGCWPYSGVATLKLEVAHNIGIQYAIEHFGRVDETIEL